MRSDRAVGLVRSLRRYPESKQRSRLEAFGCSRVWSWDERELLFRYLRQGDVVAVVVAHALGPTRHDAEAMMIAILEKHAAIYEVETELMADTPARAVKMAMKVVAGLAGDSRALISSEASKAGKKSHKKKQAARTTDAVAKKFWRSRRAREMDTIDDIMAHPDMRGWSKATAYRRFGKPARPAGRKPKA